MEIPTGCVWFLESRKAAAVGWVRHARFTMATAAVQLGPATRFPWRFFVLLFLVLLAGRLCHVDVLWVDEAYGIAGAQAMLEGKALYRDIWFDKPPLYAWVYLLVGGQGAWPLRLLDAVFCLLSCGLAFGLARRLWGQWEGHAAALFLAFFFVFGVPSATVSLAPDLLTIPFALGAVWLADARRPGIAGFVAGAALLANAKALFLLPVVLVWCWPAAALVLVGFACGLALTPLELAPQGALGDYWQQVWVWGAAYSRDTPFAHPLTEGVHRTANWMGFHAALLIPAVVYLMRKPSPVARRLAVWFLLAMATVAGGWRFYPRYYFALLPVAAVIAARGIWLIPFRWRIAVLAVTLAIPAIRFGKPQLHLAVESIRGGPLTWSDLALYDDARETAAWLRAHAQPGDTILVWGYRPEINVLAGLPPGTRFLDSQPLTGVIADRHLTRSDVTFPELSAKHREELTKTRPVWIVDGLGGMNPRLAIDQFPELAAWLASYELVKSTEGGTRVYRLGDPVRRGA